MADVRGAVVVVSRWFGGVLLGPSRFALINNCARLQLQQCGFVHRVQQQTGSKGKAKPGSK